MTWKCLAMLAHHGRGNRSDDSYRLKPEVAGFGKLTVRTLEFSGCEGSRLQ